MSTKSRKFKSIMLVDDNEIDNLINQKMVEASGVAESILTYTSARGALEFIKNVEKNPALAAGLPELIFLDIDMPLMDGFQFLDEFQKVSEPVRERINIIMLTSSANPQDQSKAKKSSHVMRYLNKPLTQESLEKLAASLNEVTV